MLWRIKSIIPVAILTVLCLCCMLRGGETAVISIDFSNEWLKVALVKVSIYFKTNSCSRLLSFAPDSLEFQWKLY